MFARTFRCVMTTPLGADVAPEVKMISATSSLAGLWSPWSGEVERSVSVVVGVPSSDNGQEESPESGASVTSSPMSTICAPTS